MGRHPARRLAHRQRATPRCLEPIAMPFRRRHAPMPILGRRPTNVTSSTSGWHAVPLASVRWRILTVLTATALGVGLAHGQDRSKEQDKANVAPLGDVALLKKLEQMEQRIRTLEKRLKRKNTRGMEGIHGQAATSAVPPAGVKPVKDRQDAETTSLPKQPKEQNGPAGVAKPDWATPAPRDLSGKTAPINKPNSIMGLTDSPVTGMSIGASGEMAFGLEQNPAAGGQWQNGFDARRLVLLPTYLITPHIIFNAEIEFEHAGSGFDSDDKLHGTAEIEQIWIDFKIIDQFNLRAPGTDFIPIGYINQHHEPTQFYSVNRPELYNGLIPSTFFAGASSVYGTIADGLTYQLQVSSSVEDFGGDFGLRTDAKTVPAFPAGYTAGIDGLNALGFARPVRGGFAQLNDTLAYAGKLDFVPSFLPGFAGSVSAYFSPDI